MSAAGPPAGALSVRAVRTVLAVVVAALVAACLVAAAVAERGLAGGTRVPLGVLELVLTFNRGAAFSLGAELPGGVLLAVTAVISAGVAGYAWRCAPAMSWAGRLGLTAVLAGALANLVDRAGDGVVTDYLHTGWWPTFNLPDTLITLGGTALVVASLRSHPDPDPRLDPRGEQHAEAEAEGQAGAGTAGQGSDAKRTDR